MKIFRLIVILTCLHDLAVADSCYEERMWSGVNGRTFRGTFHRVLPDGANAEFYTTQEKLTVVALPNLIAADQQLILDRDKKIPAQAEATAPAGDPAAFKPDMSPVRIFPPLDSKKAGAANWETLTDAVWISLLWWDQAGVLEVPRKGGLERKSEWLYKELAGRVPGAGQKGIEEYFNENLKEVAACRITRERANFDPARLGTLCSGSKAVLLKMTMTYSNGSDFLAWTALESIGADGSFVFHVFGKRFSGTVKAAPDDKEPNAAKRIEFAIANRQDLPAYYAQSEARFFLGDKYWNEAMVIRPYVYLTPGKPSPLPSEEITQAEKKPEPAPAHGLSEPGFHPRFPLRFSTSVEASREWTLGSGRKFVGFPVAREGNLTVLKNVANGEEWGVTERNFKDEDRARFCFWESCSGVPQSPQRLDLSYRLNTSKRGSFPVNIFVQGTLGRVDFPSDRSSLTFDMADGAFIATRVEVKDGQESVSKHWGKFEPERLLPREIPQFHQQEELDRFAVNTLPASAPSASKDFPSRSMNYPLRVAQNTMRDARIDFVLMKNPAVLAGLYQLLNMQSPGAADNRIVFSHYDDIPWHAGCAQMFPILAGARMTPVRIAWTNLVNDAITDPAMRAKWVEWAGNFSLELVRSAIPDQFPEGHFDIPQEARTLPPGSGKTNF